MAVQQDESVKPMEVDESGSCSPYVNVFIRKNRKGEKDGEQVGCEVIYMNSEEDIYTGEGSFKGASKHSRAQQQQQQARLSVNYISEERTVPRPRDGQLQTCGSLTHKGPCKDVRDFSLLSDGIESSHRGERPGFSEVTDAQGQPCANQQGETVASDEQSSKPFSQADSYSARTNQEVLLPPNDSGGGDTAPPSLFVSRTTNRHKKALPTPVSRPSQGNDSQSKLARSESVQSEQAKFKSPKLVHPPVEPQEPLQLQKHGTRDTSTSTAPGQRTRETNRSSDEQSRQPSRYAHIDDLQREDGTSERYGTPPVSGNRDRGSSQQPSRQSQKTNTFRPPQESPPPLDPHMFYAHAQSKIPSEVPLQSKERIPMDKDSQDQPATNSKHSSSDYTITSGIYDGVSTSTVQQFAADIKIQRNMYQRQQSAPSSTSLPATTSASLEYRKQKTEKKAKEPVGVTDLLVINDYAANEWKGVTAKAEKMLRGYKAIPKYIQCTHLRRIRGDNYCAIRAAMFQALTTQLPVLKNFANPKLREVPKGLVENGCHWLNNWSFANKMRGLPKTEVILHLGECLDVLAERAIHVTEHGKTVEERIDYILEQFNGDGRDIDFAIMEATKLLMLQQAVIMHERMQRGDDVPVWVFILFARDTSPDPERLVTNHFNNVGDTGGLEQIEMFLLGHTLQATLLVFRPSQIEAEDFVSRYPDDLGKDSPVLLLVAEDDRHYNIIATDTYRILHS